MGKNEGKKVQKRSGSSSNTNREDPVNEQWVNENLQLEPPDDQRDPYFAFGSQGIGFSSFQPGLHKSSD